MPNNLTLPATGLLIRTLERSGDTAHHQGIFNADSDLMIAQGEIDGHSGVNKFGFCNANVDSGVDTDIWDGARAARGTLIWVAPTQARTHDIVSTSATDDSASTGAKKVMVYGLTDWDTAEVSEEITMNGTSNVATVNQYVIIHRMKVTDFGSSGVNVGTITATAQTDSTITAEILVGTGQSLMAIYGVPSTQTFYMSKYWASMVKVTGTVAVDVALLVNPIPNTELIGFLHKHFLGIINVGSNYLSYDFKPYFKVPGPAIIKMQGNATAVNTSVAAGFDGVLVTN